MGVGATFLTSESFDKPELINVLKDLIVKISPNDKIILETIISNFEKDDFQQAIEYFSKAYVLDNINKFYSFKC